MTSLIGARRRAEEFDAALSSRTTSPTSPEIGALLGVVDALRSTEAPAPRADFSASLRERLMAEAAEVLTPSDVLALPPRRRGVRERRLTIAASAFVLIGGSAGMAAAAQSSAPGDALYPLKRGLENAQRAVVTDEADRGAAFLAQADDRLAEARELVRRDATSIEIGRSLSAFSTQAVTGSDIILGQFEEDRDPALVDEVRTFSAEALAALTELSAVAPADLSDEIAEAGFVLQRIDAAAAEACTDCSDLPGLEVPESMRLTAEVQRAMQQVQIGGKDVNNTHPAPAVDIPVEAPSDGPTEEPPTTEGPEGPGPILPGSKDVELPQDPQGLVDAVDGATGGLVGTVRDSTKNVLPGELGETTEDLLP